MEASDLRRAWLALNHVLCPEHAAVNSTVQELGVCAAEAGPAL